MENYELTVQRPGDEPRKKPYTYPKAAFDGFDTAVERKGRLAESIVLEQVFADGARKTVREWYRADQKTGPTVLWLVGDQNDEAVSYVAEELCPTIEDVKLVSFPIVWNYTVAPTEDTDGERAYYSLDQRLDKFLAESKLLDSTHANHLIWFPDYGTDLALRVVAMYYARYGRFPHVVEEFGIPRKLSVTDLNKVYAK